ncbi:MAG: tetratricopeptide repeat protein [Acidobacteria bacterium]|nr:tetratricopeptide repeat protein [Acidobacteriota bacterium]
MKRLSVILFAALMVNTAYLAGFASPTIFYMANVLFHVLGGVAAVGLFLWCWRTDIRRAAMLSLVLCAAAGAWLMWVYNTLDQRWLLWSHIGLGLLGLALLPARFRNRSLILAAIPLAILTYRSLVPDPADSIRNPLVVPTSMEEEGGGPKSPFWPSSAKTNVGGTIPSNFFMDSKLCGECHKDVYEQWNSSVHHFASFNNQFYRKSIEYMQSLDGTRGSKWCAGCHDHAVFFNGRFDKPIKDQIDTPEAQNGLGCVSCHSIVHVDGSMGNGGFTIEYPPLHDLASSRHPLIRKLDRFLTFTDPEPHRRTFMKPFMRGNAEYCSTCHKVHLDVPVNNYRWLRGFNDYDNWQASGISGQGARSFYYPPQSQSCSDCHMPLVDSKDPGNRNGKVHSHRFPAANMAVAYANRDKEQMDVTEKFLKSGFITVDIFAAAPVEKTGEVEMRRRSGEGPQLMSTFAVGEEAESPNAGFIREVGKLAAPIDAAGASYRPGDTVRVDVVVRTRKIGHFFPGGTVDSFDVWLELTGEDATGKKVFWSGRVEDNGKGPVERGAHFYRSYLLDAEGNMINKRNAFQARSVLYVRLIPPGAADVAHFRVKIPPDAKGPIKLHAKLNYRKFAHYYTQFVYAGQPAPGQETKATRDFDSRDYTFHPSDIPKNVSGAIKDHIPDVPIVTMAEARSELPLGPATEWKPVVRKQDRERWNDWGIGLLLQGDLKGAEYAFKRVTEAEPGYADGWLNVARALIQEGETEAAKPYIERALSINPKLGRIHFFKALIQKADGQYDEALASLQTCLALYPRDRVVLNQLGRIHFLKREYRQAVEALQRVLAVDAEDVQAHYNLMLAYRGLGDTQSAAREEKLFRRFKADESAQSITAKPRMLSPEDNNERQQIHDHDSAPVKGAGQ